MLFCSEDKLTVAAIMADTIMEMVIHQLENSVSKLVSNTDRPNKHCLMSFSVSGALEFAKYLQNVKVKMSRENCVTQVMFSISF